MEKLSDRIKDFPTEQFVDWLCLSCVDVRASHSDELAQEDINKIREAVTIRLAALEDKLRIKQNHIRLRDSYIEELEERAESAEEKVAERDALAAENKVLDSAIGAIADAYETGLKDLLAQEIDIAVNTTTPATDAYADQLRAKCIPEQLKEIGELIRTQDNRITDQPMFVVFEKREIIGSDEHSPSRIAWVCESEEVDELRSKRLELLYQNGRETCGYDRYAMQEIDVFVTACFTEKGCKDYLRQNRHNLRHPYIYADGSYRNDEYQAVRNWLESLPRSASMDGA